MAINMFPKLYKLFLSQRIQILNQHSLKDSCPEPIPLWNHYIAPIKLCFLILLSKAFFLTPYCPCSLRVVTGHKLKQLELDSQCFLKFIWDHQESEEKLATSVSLFWDLFSFPFYFISAKHLASISQLKTI